MQFEIPGINNSSNTQISIKSGDVLVFIGANGTGKTRLGFYLEEKLFALTNTGIEQKNLELANEKRNLEIHESTVNSIVIQLARIEALSNPELLEQCINYQQQRKILDDRSVYTQIEIANMLLSGQMSTASLTFQSNEFIGNTIPPRNLGEIRGGEIIVGDLHLEVDILNAKASDVESIESARKYILTKLDAQLNSNQRQLDKIQARIEKLESELLVTVASNFSYCERIAAHRSLVVRESSPPKDANEAVNELLFGNANQTNNTNSKWGGKPFGSIHTDCDKLMIAFLSEEAETGARFRQGNYVGDKPATNFDKALTIWNQLLPHRTLKLDGLKLIVQATTNDSYPISEMSEGERTLFYIIGKCLFAKSNSLIIIDEPDIHIHKAILPTYFDLIERVRSDCAFIYITHDLEFAASRRRSSIYALHSYVHKNKWDIEEVESTDIPEIIFNRVCGSRKDILFVEGQDQSLDKIYSYLYQNFTVIPVGSCEEVKAYTKSMNRNSTLHRASCFGLIDRDDLNEDKINALLNEKIYVLPVAIIENIFLLPSIAQHVFRLTGEGYRFDSIS